MGITKNGGHIMDIIDKTLDIEEYLKGLSG